MAGVDAQLVDQAVIDLLRAELDFPIGDGEMPSPATATDLGEPTADESEGPAQILQGGAMVRRLAATFRELSTGFIGAQDSMRVLRYEIVGYGIQQGQAVRCSTMAYQLLTDKTADGYTHPLTVAGHEVMRRAWEGDTGSDRRGISWEAGNIVALMVHATA